MNPLRSPRSLRCHSAWNHKMVRKKSTHWIFPSSYLSLSIVIRVCVFVCVFAFVLGLHICHRAWNSTTFVMDKIKSVAKTHWNNWGMMLILQQYKQHKHSSNGINTCDREKKRAEDGEAKFGGRRCRRKRKKLGQITMWDVVEMNLDGI